MLDLLRRCNFPSPGTAVDCAVSGGPDSLALLVLAVESGCSATAWHIDHGLRPDSHTDSGLVEEVANGLGVSVISVSVKVDPGSNLEARARQARLDALPRGVLTGHTADDQAETVILNLLRGSGIHGVAGIGDPDRRPLLDLRRSETRAFCASLGLRPIDDPMNLDPRFVRNRVRQEVLPLLAEVFSRDPVPLLVRHANRAREAAFLLDGLVDSVDPTDVANLSALPIDLARLAIRNWLIKLLDGSPPDSASIDRVLSVVRGEIRATEVIGGLAIKRSKGRLLLVRAGGPKS